MTAANFLAEILDPEIASSVAIRDEAREITYGELDNVVGCISSRLGNLEIGKGTRLGILAANCIENAVLMIAAFRLGVVAVPLNTRFVRRFHRDALRMCEAQLLLFDSIHKPAAFEFDIPTANLSEVVDLSPGKVHPTQPGVDLNQLATIIFTSGSTGSPRGVMLSAGNHYASAIASNMNIPLKRDSCWLACLPLFHVGGLAILFRCMLAGCSVSVMETYDADRVNQLIDDRTLTHLSLVPTMLADLVSTRGKRPFPSNLKCILLGGAAVPPGLLRAALDLNAPVMTTYGMTETASQVCTVSPGDPVAKLQTSGRPLGSIELRIVDEVRVPVENEAPGEIQVRGKQLFMGYLDEIASDTFDSDGWFSTGDIGTMDHEGYLTVIGRKDEMMISGGENIHPAAIERAAEGFPGVEDCAAIGVPDSRWGTRPVLFVKPASARFRLSDLKMHLEIELSRLLLPRTIVVVGGIPRTAIGKVDLQKLREMYEQREIDPD
jgi:O-succinylbenzoic acid--CoA ligase